MIRLFILFVVSFETVYSDCPVETIEKIKTFWNGKPPENVLKSNVGLSTYVWMSSDFIEDPLRDGLLCFATNLDADETTSTDILFYTNRTADEINYFQKESNGVITLHSHGEADDTQYIISHKNHVTTFWQCKVSNLDSYEPFVGISVRISQLYSEEAKSAVEDGLKTLTSLGLNTGSPLSPCEKEYFKISA